MKRLALKLGMVLAVLLLGGCSTTLLVVNEADAPVRLQKLIEDQQYERALMVVDRIKEDSPLYPEMQLKRKEIVQFAELYDAETVKESAALIKELKWQDVEKLFDEALDRLLPTSRSHQAYQDFLAKRTEFIADQQLKLNLLLADRMVEEGEYRQNVHDADKPTWGTSWDLKQYKERREEVAEFLASQGLAAWEESNYGDAQKYLKLSFILSPEENVQLALKKVNEELDTRWSQHVKKRNQKLDKNYSDKVAEYQLAWTAGEYWKAREILAQLAELNPKDKANHDRQTQLDHAIEQQIQQAIARGEKSYSAGNIQLALSIWSEASKLSPEHLALKQHIDRAERFIGNYESLKSRKGVY